MNELNEEQQTVAHAIRNLSAGGRLVVSGRAGSGKTYAIVNSVAERKALFLAPTHAARTVLEQELCDKRHAVSTIHSAIGWSRSRNDDLKMIEVYRPARKARTYLERSKKKKVGSFLDVDIIVADEFSLVNAFLFQAIEEYAEEFDLPVVYSGDRFQLSPVSGSEVITDQGFETITMDGSMRFPKNSEIFQIGEVLRNEIEAGPSSDVPYLYGGTEVQVVSGQEWIGSLTDGYQNGDSLLALTYDNASLQRLRGKVRKVNHDWLADGDLVTCKQTDDLFRNGEQFTIDLAVRDMRVLTEVPSCVSKLGALTFHGSTITFRGTDKVAFVLEDEKVIDKQSSRVRHLYSNGKLNKAQAGRILDWIEQFNRFELSALTTVHKSQGRSVDTVFIDTNSVLQGPAWISPSEHMRLLYTAITRARKRVVFFEMRDCCEQKGIASEGAVLVRVKQDEYQLAS